VITEQIGSLKIQMTKEMRFKLGSMKIKIKKNNIERKKQKKVA